MSQQHTSGPWRPQVQDKALDVLSQQLRGDRDALAAHLPLILAAAAQPATSVRRRAVDILWDCYINGAAYGEGADGARRVALLLVKCLHLYSGAPHAHPAAVIHLNTSTSVGPARVASKLRRGRDLLKGVKLC